MNSFIRSIVICLGLTAFAAPLADAAEGRYAGAGGDFVPGELIVKMKPGASLQAAELSALGVQAQGARTSGGEIIYRIEPSVMGTMSERAAKERTLQVMEELKKRPDVEYVQPNYILYPQKTPNDPLFQKQWHYFNNGTGPGESPGGIDLPKVWETNTGGNVVVTVIDTGILPDHPDIKNSPNLIKGYDFISDASKANDGDGRDADPTDTGDAIKKDECGSGQPPQDYPNSWHGTHVAGTIGVGLTDNGTGVAGINWTVKVQALRVLGKCGGSTTDINDAIRWAAGIHVDGVPDNTTPAKVINMSLGGGGTLPIKCSTLSPATQSAVNDAVNKGTTVVVAAGNSGQDAYNFIPAGCDNVITVAASGPDGKLVLEDVGRDSLFYSNWGTTVEIMAPGGKAMPGCTKPADGVLSTVGSDTSGACAVAGNYAFYNGTSMASPHVAGVAALWLAQDPSLTPKTLLAELQKWARPRTSADCPKPCGAGLLSAARGVPPVTGVNVSLTLEPDQASYAPGASATARATVQSNGAAQPGKTVTFSSSDSGIALITPASATTDSQGQATASVKANATGSAKITAAAEGKQASKTITVQQTQPPVPDLSFLGLMGLLATVLSLGLVRRKSGA